MSARQYIAEAFLERVASWVFATVNFNSKSSKRDFRYSQSRESSKGGFRYSAAQSRESSKGGFRYSSGQSRERVASWGVATLSPW